MPHSRLMIASITLLGFAARGVAAEPDANVDALLEERVENDLTVGISAAIITPDGIRYHNRGKRSASGGEPVTEDTVYEIGSITKVFTAILLADMVVKDQVGLTDPVSKFLPESVTVPERNGQKITLEHLARHTSGLPRLPDNFEPEDPSNPYRGYTADRLYAFLSGHSLSRDIGSKYEYSNLGAGLLGQCLSLKAGKPYPELVVERVCEPLGMGNTKVQLTDAMKQHLAKGHVGHTEVGMWDLDALAGAGGLRSSTADMARFVRACMGLEQTRLDDAIKLTLADPIETGGPTTQVALGWHISTRFDTPVYWHNGGTGGYHSFIGFDREKKRGVVVLCNSTEDIDGLALHLLDPRYELAPVRKAIKVDPSILETYVGEYRLSPMHVFDVTLDDGQLMAQLTGQGAFPIYPESQEKFFYRVVDAQITFVKDEEGKVTQLILHQHGRDMPAERME